MHPEDPDAAFLRVGGWLIRARDIAAIGPDDDGTPTLVLSCGLRLVLDEGEARELWRRFEPEAEDWRK
jgi:hypothetical protein